MNSQSRLSLRDYGLKACYSKWHLKFSAYHIKISASKTLIIQENFI